MSLWVHLISGTSYLPTWATLAFIQFFQPAMCPPASKHWHMLFLLPGMFSSLLKSLPRWFLQTAGQMSLLQGIFCWLCKLDYVHYSFIPLNLTFIVPLQFTVIQFCNCSITVWPPTRLQASWGQRLGHFAHHFIPSTKSGIEWVLNNNLFSKLICLDGIKTENHRNDFMFQMLLQFRWGLLDW